MRTKKIRLDDFQCDACGVMVSGSSGTPAGYMDGAEGYLSSVLQKSRDLGSFSRELMAAVKDWPSLYHLSPYRTTILDCLGLRIGRARVLELGAGCGAVTRWLGEKFHDVTSIEGNYQRAKVARLRCRDLSSVKIYSANFLDLDLSRKFDIATLIGVLEYSHLYHPLFRNNPDGAALSTLQMVYESLADCGVLVLALENRLGLKYFSGAREDHSGKVFDGIQGYPSKNAAVTFSAAGLESMLMKAGFTSASFYLPFPDYKLASTIIRGDGLSLDHYLHNWIETPFPDRSGTGRDLLFNENLTLRELSRAGLLRDMSNSFLIVATKGERTAVQDALLSGDDDWIARHYSLGRHAYFNKIATLRQIQPGQLIIENTSPHEFQEPGPVTDLCFTHRFTREDYCRGDQLIYQVFEMLASDRFDSDFINIVRSLNTFLLNEFSTGETDAAGIPLLKGDALDALFWNIIITEGSGKWVFIDREWSYAGSLPSDFILWRNLHHLLMRYHRYIGDNITYQIRHEFISACIRTIYPSFNRERYERAQCMDDHFQAYAHHGIAADGAVLHNIYEREPASESETGEKSGSPEYISTAGCHVPGFGKQGRETIKGLASIIIPVFNNLKYTVQCLEAVAANTGYKPYEVVIVDNCSTDGTKEYLASLEGDVRVLTNDSNLGFAVACNQGAKAAEGDYLVFLNNDTVPLAGWLENLVKVVSERADTAIVGSKLLYPDNTIQHAGVIFDVKDSKFFLSHIYRRFDKDHPAVNHIREFNAVTAACMLVKKEVFLDLGMFDEGYTNGYEDVDFCLKARERGHKIIYNPESVLYHHESVTDGRFDFGEKNTNHFLRRWGDKIQPDYKMKMMEDGLTAEYLPDNKIRYVNVDAVKEEIKRSCGNGGNGASKDVQIKTPDFNCSRSEKGGSAIKKIAIVRGANLNKWEMQNYEPLSDIYDITAYTTLQTIFDISRIDFPVVKLPFQSQGLLLDMQGLEGHLADKDLVFSADITYKFSAQAVLAKKKNGCKVICLEWENIPFNYEGYNEARIIKETVRNGADHFIAVTERAKEALMLEGVQEEKIDVIPMGIDLTLFRPDDTEGNGYRRKLGIKDNEVVVLYIGRMVWEKGIYDFVHAAALVLRERAMQTIPARFIMAGSGNEIEALRERAAGLGIISHMVFIENTPYEDMHKMHNVADIFVLPSIPVKNWQEQFGMVLIESMACGKPVISTLSGSIPEVVGDAGILVQPNDHLSLYEAMKRLITDKGLREKTGDKALARARKHFNSRKNAEKFREVFEKVMSRKTREDKLREAYILGLERWEEGDREAGFDMVCRTFMDDPDRKDVLDSIVRMGRELNKYEEVEKSLREYLTYHPADLEELASLSEALVHTGKPEQAEKELRKIIIFDPGNSRASAILDDIKNVARGV